jgi:hypothetical protein
LVVHALQNGLSGHFDEVNHQRQACGEGRARAASGHVDAEIAGSDFGNTRSRPHMDVRVAAASGTGPPLGRAGSTRIGAAGESDLDAHVRRALSELRRTQDEGCVTIILRHRSTRQNPIPHVF